MTFFAVINEARRRVKLHCISMTRSRGTRSRSENVVLRRAVILAELPHTVLALITAFVLLALIVVVTLRPVSANASSVLPGAQSPQQQPLSAAESAPPAGALGRQGDGRQGTWAFSTRHGMDFAIVLGQSTIVNGSEDDRVEAESLRTKIHRSFIWFIHDGNSYIIQNTAVINTAKQLYAPLEALGRQQEALGKQQKALGEQQEKLGNEMEAIRVNVPDDLEVQLHDLELTVRDLGSTGSQTQLAGLQDQIGRLESRIGSLQSNAGHAEELLGRQQGELGREQGRLGQQQGHLGREESRLGHQASRKMQAILQRSVSNGLAERVS